MKSVIKVIFIIALCLSFPVTTHAVYVYVGGPSKSLPKPFPPRGTLVSANYIADGGSSDYIYCSYGSVKAYKYTEYTCRVRCDYNYEVTETNYSSGNSFTYRYSGVEYYDVNIQPIRLKNVPSTKTMNVGDVERIDWTYDNPGGVSEPKVEWSSSNYSVADVNSSGYITARGSGTATITGKNNAGPNVEIKVTVNDIAVTGATISSSYSVVADQSKPLSVTVTPSNATVKKKEWYSADASIARINSSTGELTGVWPGKTKVWCIVNGTVKSNEAEVKVTEPSLTFKNFSQTDGATEVETKPTLTAEFSHNLSRGDNYNSILLTDGNGQQVNGTLSISGTMLKFTPTKHLQPTTNYTWTIPANALKNKWGTSYTTTRKLSFTTADWKRMTLSLQPEAKFLNRGDQIVLTCSAPEATIYYSTDGSNPSKAYSSPLAFEGDITLRAIARLDGYYDSNEVTHQYLQSVEIVEKFPGEKPLYNYADVNPYIVFSQQIKQGTLFSTIAIKKEGREAVDCQVLIYGNTLFFVPKEPLEQGSAFTALIPEGSIVTEKGEENKAIEWIFATGDYATAASTGGPELMTAIKTDGTLWSWGKRLKEANAEDGSYSYTVQADPSSFVSSDVTAVSSGYMHHAIIKRDGSLWMWGRQLCGEFGNGSTTASAQPVKVMDGVKSVSCGLQTTAIVKTDGTLWMCGRNDMGQIDESRMVKKQFVKIAEGVSNVTLNWGSLQIVKADGTRDSRTWDEKIDGQRNPSNSVSTSGYEAVQYGWKNAVALGKDGSVWTWDDSSEGATPTKVIEGRTSSALTGLKAVNEAVTIAVGGKGVLTALPVPLTADYSTMKWTSDNSSVVTVSNRGVVTGIKEGKTAVTAEIASASGQRFSKKFTVIVNKGTSLKGDANGDGKVDIVDVTMTISQILGQNPAGFNKTAADVNGDGRVDIVDVTSIIDIILKAK